MAEPVYLGNLAELATHHNFCRRISSECPDCREAEDKAELLGLRLAEQAVDQMSERRKLIMELIPSQDLAEHMSDYFWIGVRREMEK